MDKKVDKKENNYKKEKDLYTETIIKMMKNMNEIEKKRIYKFVSYVYNKKEVQEPGLIFLFRFFFYF